VTDCREQALRTKAIPRIRKEVQAESIKKAAFAAWFAPKKDLAPQVGLEPTTLRLTAECSAIELLRSKGNFLIFNSGFNGREEDRTPDLRIANAALSQLSYTP
jgi:hypothetical protein